VSVANWHFPNVQRRAAGCNGRWPRPGAATRPVPAQAAVEALFAQFSPVVTALASAAGQGGRGTGGGGPGV